MPNIGANRDHETGSAIVGTGFIGPVHVEALRRLGRSVVGILGSSLARSEDAARELRIPKAYRDFDELLADPAVTVVHLTSPNRHHFAQCQQALAARKHVLCEKPLAMTSTETRTLVELATEAESRGIMTAINTNVRFYPLCLELRRRVRAGELGRITHVVGSYLQDWLLYDTDFNWRVLAAEGGALRAVADIGTHWIDLIRFITDLEVEEVCADLGLVYDSRLAPSKSVETFTTGAIDRASRQVIPIDTEDHGSILMRFRGGARATLTVSQVMAGRKNCLRFDLGGTLAAAAWDSEEPNSLHLGYRDRPNERLIRDPSLLGAEVRPFANYPGGHAEGFPDTFKQLFRAFYDRIATGKPGPIPVPSFADGDVAVRICEAILASHRNRCWVRV